MTETGQGKGRRLLPPVILALVFLAPVALSWLLYGTGWRSSHLMNYGTLVQPPRPAHDFQLKRADGSPLGAEFLKGKWTLILLDRVPCDRACGHRLWVTRQVRIALGKDMGRVQRLLLVTEGDAAAAERRLHQEHPYLVVAQADRARMQVLFPWFELKGQDPADVIGHVYLVDPLGNLMMRYPRDLEPKGLHRDLKRLLQASRIG